MFTEIPKEEFLEAVISAMRSVLQQLASKNIPQVQNTITICPFRPNTFCIIILPLKYELNL